MPDKVIELGIRLTADGKSFTGSLSAGEKALRRLRGETGKGSQAQREMARATRQTAEATRQMSGAVSGLHRHLAGYATQYLSFQAAIRSFRAVLANTTRQEQAVAQVAARIESTGGAAGYAVEEIEAMAAALQRVTTFGDEEILEAQGILGSFKNVAGDAFREATEAALNLSVGLRQSIGLRKMARNNCERRCAFVFSI